MIVIIYENNGTYLVTSYYYMSTYLCGCAYLYKKYWNLRLNPKMYTRRKSNLCNSRTISDLLVII